jgi:radical SAM enzyme (TIGR01210 family)
VPIYHYYKYFDNDPAHNGQSRLAIALKTLGCSHAKQYRPCLYCAPFSPSLICNDYLAIVDNLNNTLKNIPHKNIDVLSIHCPGSFLDKNDLPQETLIELLDIFQSTFEFRKFSVESHPRYTTTNNLILLKNLLTTDHKIEIGVGFDTISSNVRNKIIGKGISISCMKKSIANIIDCDMSPVPFVVAGPPGIKVQLAMHEAKKTIIFLKSLGVNIAWMEPVILLPGSKATRQYEVGKYSLIPGDLFEEIFTECSKFIPLRRGGDITTSVDSQY